MRQAREPRYNSPSRNAFRPGSPSGRSHPHGRLRVGADSLFERREVLRGALDWDGQRIRTERAREAKGVALRACHRDGLFADVRAWSGRLRR